ncbi:MAG: PD-(D/E)XK nuclease family protein, partial [Candidatus Omnitrophica bacterium]|nr:PD-(D/E)XK nuclease family protein [Candidatus Omnitrophota bacterium]
GREGAAFFEPLQAARQFPKKERPSVELIAVGKEADESAQEMRTQEARVLAREIYDLVESGFYQYKDFAMLFRAGTDIFLYEYELRALNIPYYVVSGRGFYHQPEIRDLIAFLEVLENPHLDIPLAAVLRSPMVQASDDALFWLANHSTRTEPRRPLYHAFLGSDEIIEMDEESKQRLKSFRSFFLKLLEEKEKWTISECLELILNETQYGRYVLSLPQGKRHFANLRKLLEIAREVESRSSIHLGDFIRYVKGLETQEVRESEAQVEALEGNVVKLMTVHKSKGLEFKVVILPDLNRRGEKKKSRFLMNPKYGLGIRVLNEVTRKFEDTFTFQKIKEKLVQTAREESKRLLYVGMTRAQDHLILSGISRETDEQEEGSGFDDGANWYEWIDSWSSSGESRFVRKTPEVPSEKKGRLPSALVDHEKVRTALEQNQPIEIKAFQEADSIIESLKPIPPVYFERIDLPVSAFVAFEHDPEAYRRTYEVGALEEESPTVDSSLSKNVGRIPARQLEGGHPSAEDLPQDDMKEEEWDLNEDETELTPADFGTTIHKIFEYLVSQPEKANERLPNLITRFASDFDPKVREEFYRLSLQFIQSKQFLEIRKAKRRHAEIPFVFRLQGGIIQGTLDLLYQTADGKWVILDYKTSQVEGKSLEAFAARYQAQLMLYALACHELLKISVARAALYFVRTDQTYDFSLEALNFANLKSDFEQLHQKIITQRKSWITS